MLRLKNIQDILYEFAYEMILLDRVGTACPEQPLLVHAALWEPVSPAIVLGRHSRLRRELHLQAAHQDGVSVLRRLTGGTPVLVAPGVLCIGLVFGARNLGALEWRETCRRVLKGITEVLRRLGREVQYRYPGDLALGDRKVVGSAARTAHNAFLFHASILCEAPLELVPRYLPQPRFEPPYRQGRDHLSFLTNLSLDPERVANALAETFCPAPCPIEVDEEQVEQLARHYGSATWLALGQPLRPSLTETVGSAFAPVGRSSDRRR